MDTPIAPLQVVARLHCGLPAKFGIPRQSGLVGDLPGRIVFEPPFRRAQAVRGLEAFSHIWLLWHFSAAGGEGWSPLVRPPRLGGNRRVGVFASRSPFRPNRIGLSCVRLQAVRMDPALGPVLEVLGADLMDGTPILDIKPYLAYTDAHPEASSGYAALPGQQQLEVDFPPALLQLLPPQVQQQAVQLLAQDPRPGYLDTPGRVFGFSFAGFDIRFTVEGGRAAVCAVVPLPPDGAKGEK